MSEIKRIGVLTGGGDCSGLNAVVRAVTLTAINKYGCEVQVSSSGKCLNTPVYGKCNLAIPQNGYVISGHGKGSDWILANLKKGKTVKPVGSSIVVK